MKKFTFMSSMLACLMVLMLSASGCGIEGFKDYSLDETTFKAEDLKMIEEHTGIPLPAGSRGLNMFYAGARSIEPIYVARIEIPAAAYGEFAEYIEQIHNDDMDLGGNRLTKEVDWWHPPTGNTCIERIFSPGGSYAHVLLCHENGDWILYVEFYHI